MEENYSLYQRLKKLDESDQYPFHMPGHKRNAKSEIPGGMAQLDITEIDGFDNLHHAQGILKEAMNRAAELYHSEETHFLVNGSSCGILTAISTAVREGDTLILGRNAHASAYHGVYLQGARIKSLFPEMTQEYGLYGIVSPESVRQALEETPKAGAVMITSPTYDGFVSNIREIADIIHFYGKILIVDEAHGAHFGLDQRLPESSVTCGADLVIQSMHKTLPALTQTALLHVNGKRVDRDRVKRFLKIYQTSSPSYLLMGSMDHCIRQIQKHGREWFDQFFANRKTFMESVRDLRYLRVLDQDFCIQNGMKALDPGKIVILTQRSGYTGVQLQRELLEKYRLQMEMAGPENVVAIITVMDEQEGFRRLSEALHEIDRACADRRNSLEPAGDCNDRTAQERLFYRTVEERKQTEAVCSVKTAMDAADDETEMVALKDSAGRIITEFVYLYPPGIPIVIPGERMTDVTVALIQSYQKNHLSVQGMSDWTGSAIKCFRQHDI